MVAATARGSVVGEVTRRRPEAIGEGVRAIADDPIGDALDGVEVTSVTAADSSASTSPRHAGVREITAVEIEPGVVERAALFQA